MDKDQMHQHQDSGRISGSEDHTPTCTLDSRLLVWDGALPGVPEKCAAISLVPVPAEPPYGPPAYMPPYTQSPCPQRQTEAGELNPHLDPGSQSSSFSGSSYSTSQIPFS